MKLIAHVGIGLMLSLSLLSITAGAQDSAQKPVQSKPADQAASGPSLGDYARHIRKDGGQAKGKPRVFDNDDLPKDDKLSVVGVAQPPAAAENAAETKPAEGAGTAVTGEKKATPAAATSPEEDAKKREAALKEWQTKIAAQREQIDLMQRELDVMQREYQIRAAAFYADAGNRLRNSGAWDKQDAQYKQQIADKQKAIDDAKQKLEDLQEEARKDGAPTSVREP
jgi:hypothetical protein